MSGGVDFQAICVGEAGRGTDGVVKLCRSGSNKLVAVKEIPLTSTKQRHYDEAYAMSQLHLHPNIVTCVDVVVDERSLFLVTEYAQGGDLLNLITSQPHSRLGETFARNIFVQVAVAVSYAHSKGFVHRDIKPENVFLDLNGNPILGDWGFATSWDPSALQHGSCGSPPYSSPEISNGLTYYGPEVDVWSLGVLLYAMTTGTLPFGNCRDSLPRYVARGKFYVPNYLSGALVDLIKSMLTVDPKKRASIVDVLSSPWCEAFLKLEDYHSGIVEAADMGDLDDDSLDEDLYFNSTAAACPSSTLQPGGSTPSFSPQSHSPCPPSPSPSPTNTNLPFFALLHRQAVMSASPPATTAPYAAPPSS